MLKVLEEACKIRGCISLGELAIHVMLYNMIAKKEKKIISAEVGYFYGRSSYIPITLGTSCHLVLDPYCSTFNSERYKIDKSNKVVKFFEEDSASEITANKLLKYNKKVNFMSIDGKHSLTHVLADLKLADSLLSDNGIILCDDVSYPCVNLGINTFLKEHTEYAILITYYNQMCLCKKDYLIEYKKDFIETEIRKYYEYTGLTCNIKPIGNEAGNGFLYQGVSISTDNEEGTKVGFVGLYTGRIINRTESTDGFFMPEYKDLSYLNN